MQSNDRRPLLALTLGDPAGVGPEIVARTAASPEILSICRPLAIGCPAVLREVARLSGVPAEIVALETPDDAVRLARSDDPRHAQSPDRILCLAAGPQFRSVDFPDIDTNIQHVPSPSAADILRAGRLDARCGEAAFCAVKLAAQMAIDHRIDGLVTAPLHKEALHLAGHDYPGHTELLAEMCGVRDYAMMLYLGPDEIVRSPHGLAVVHVTLHTAMRNVFHEMTPEVIREKTELVHHFMQRMGCRKPRIAICALNCHNGEGGLFGDEERTMIAPAVTACQAVGLHVTGPLSVDTIFVHARDGRYDAVVAMYHDQGHIALKLIGMHHAVNITLGLPIVRTSVAHGTAMEIAWKKTASQREGEASDPNGGVQISSMIEAIRCAARLAQ